MSDSDTAFAAAYQWRGEPITWSKRHHWNWFTIARGGRFTTEQSALLAAWLGMMDTAGMRQLERDWRTDPDTVFEEFAQFTAEHLPTGGDTGEAVDLINQMFEDIENSTDEVDSDAGTEGGGPKKSAATRSTSTNSNQFSHA